MGFGGIGHWVILAIVVLILFEIVMAFVRS